MSTRFPSLHYLTHKAEFEDILWDIQSVIIKRTKAKKTADNTEGPMNGRDTDNLPNEPLFSFHLTDSYFYDFYDL